MRISAPSAPIWLPNVVTSRFALALPNGSAHPVVLPAAGHAQPRVLPGASRGGAAISGSAHAYIQRFAEHNSTHPGLTAGTVSGEDAQLRRLAQMSGAARSNFIALAVKARPLGAGRDAHVYALPGFDALVLRARRGAQGNALADGLAFSRIAYDGGLKALPGAPNLGIPRAVLIPVTHPLARSQALAPYDVHLGDAEGPTSSAVDFVLVRRCTGRRLGEAHVAAYQDLIEAKDTATDLAADGRYRSFLAAYAHSLHGLGALPASSYRAAFAALAACENAAPSVALDFQHTGNVVLDNAKAQFGFFDLGFMPPKQSRDSGSVAAEFIALLIGKRNPREWQCIKACDRAEFRPLFKQLFQKIAAAALLPDLRTAPQHGETLAEFNEYYGNCFC